MGRMLKQAIEFFNKEPLLRVQGLFSINRGTAEVKAVCDDGVLMYETKGEIYMLFAGSEEAVKKLLAKVPDVDFLMTDYTPMDDWVKQARGFDMKAPCINVVYEKKEPIAISTDLRLGALTEDQVDLITPHYHSYDQDTLRLFIREGQLLGGYLGETLVGFLGWHDEGAMGMLHIFEEHRRKGYAYALEALQTNLMLSRGKVPHGQVYVGNDASLALQKKLGFSVEERTCCWFFSQ